MLKTCHNPATSGRQAQLAITELVRISRTTHQPNACLAEHSHDVATVTVVLSGGYHENLGKGDVQLSSMAVAVKPAHAPHSNRVDVRGARCLLLEFPQRTVDELNEFGGLFASATTIDLTRSAGVALRMLVPTTTLDLDELAMELVAILNDETNCRPPVCGRHWLERVRDYLHEDGGSHLSLRRLAELAGYHPVYLSRAFKRRFGESIGSYRQRLRVSRAARDIADDSAKSLSEIAQRRGYHDHSHLSHDFCAHTGINPAKWRTLSQK